jgi:hypothetical protein
MTMEEPVGVRLARIEEGLVYVHKKMDEHHEAQMSALLPLIEKTQNHEIKFATIDRDYRWVSALAVAAVTVVPIALTGLEIYLHYFRT